ncbi:c-type cytochrome biogenesis protein CcmI [Thiocapsa rosea]|uniref:Cytochrome c-type biogenesis protein CcmH n=1 Tax=Thiocapsa rosea TaxID=69360 RepID=A0A495VD42_9GAMM|nr:c-type cytochrome biogenesis protein CcmI [Thiocapsa rosea]RKT46543.1 cytochrome c-type biogenesis protein CcmH [Thiocapsa rosea]
MTIFWILVTGLAGLALLFVLAPLLSVARETDHNDVDLDKVNLGLFKQQLAELDADLAAGKLDESQYDSARQDLEREALNNLDTKTGEQPRAMSLPNPRLTALALVVAVPASALALYLMLGSQEMIPRLDAGTEDQVAARGHNGAADGMSSLDVLVAQLEERLQKTPDDTEGWIMLGRTYFAMQDAAKAETAWARAYALRPKDSQVLVAYADALAANNDNSLEGRPSALIAEALEIDPNDVTARWLSGMAAFQRGQFTAAAVSWKRVLGEIDPESEDAAELRRLIDNAEQRAGVVPSAAGLAEKNGAGELGSAGDARASNGDDERQPESKPANQADAGAPAIEVEVSLAPALLDRSPPDTTVFVYAKAAAGPPMPLAVQRIRVADLPKTLRLDDSMAMMPTMKLSRFPQVIVGARVSTSGQAMPQSGDLEGETGLIPSSGSTQVTVSIDRVRP